MAKMRFELTGMESSLFKYAKSKNILRNSFKEFFRDSSLKATEKFKEGTPLGHTGLLRAGWKFDYNEDGMRVYNKTTYGEAVNSGRKAGGISRADQKNILDWVRKSKKGQSFASNFSGGSKSERDKKAAKTLIWKITKKGTKGQKFFQKAIRKIKPEIKERFDSLRFVIVRRLTSE